MSPLVSGIASIASLIFNATSSGSGKPAAARRGTVDAQPEPSLVLSLSPQAEAMAGLAGKGILVSQGELDPSLSATARGNRSSLAQAAGALQGAAVSTEDFQVLLARFGADDAQKAQLTAGFDANRDGTITQSEFLDGLAKTRGDQAGSGFSQAVMALMDRNGVADGRVADKEFAALTTAFALAGAKHAGVV